MADSTITNLAELINAASGDFLVIDDISEGASTRTKKISVYNLIATWLGITEVPELNAEALNISNYIDLANGDIYNVDELYTSVIYTSLMESYSGFQHTFDNYFQIYDLANSIQTMRSDVNGLSLDVANGLRHSYRVDGTEKLKIDEDGVTGKTFFQWTY